VYTDAPGDVFNESAPRIYKNSRITAIIIVSHIGELALEPERNGCCKGIGQKKIKKHIANGFKHSYNYYKGSDVIIRF
jgi:hypothetical protein